jgi:WD40 repeat protein
VWNLRGVCLKTLNEHTSDVSCVKKVTKNKIATGSFDTTIKLWSIDSVNSLKTLTGHSHSISCLQFVSPNTLLSAATNEIYSWDLESGKIIRKLVGHTDKIKRIESDEKNGTLITCSDDCTVKIWDLRSNKCTSTINEEVNCIKVVWDNHIAFGSNYQFKKDQIQIWDTRELKCVQSTSNPSSIFDLEFREKKDLISSSGKLIKQWNIETLESYADFNAHKRTINRIKLFSNDILVSCSDDLTIKLWNLEKKSKNEKCIKTISLQG